MAWVVRIEGNVDLRSTSYTDSSWPGSTHSSKSGTIGPVLPHTRIQLRA